MLYEDFGISSGITVDAFNMPTWAQELLSSGIKLTAESDIILVGSYEMKPYKRDEDDD